MRIAAPIRKGPSAPLDSSTPSFLTTLPPEIRNAIYEYAFVSHDELVIIDAHEYTKQPAWEQDYEDWVSEIYSADVERTQEHTFAVRDVRLPISLLRTCRQVYHEAASILYGRQKIRITVAPHRHNGNFRQLRTAVRWLKSIGSQYKLLTRLVIDTSALCPDECAVAGRTNCAPFLKALWLRPGLEFVVEYIRSGIEIDKRVHESDLGSSYPKSTSAGLVGEMIADLSTKDELGLRRYTSFGRLIRSIWIDGDDQYGIVKFASSTDILHYHDDTRAYEVGVSSRGFGRGRNDGRLAWSPIHQQNSSMLKRLPQTILETIMRYIVSGTEDVIVFDLDNRTTHGLDLRIFAIDAKFRRELIQYHHEYNATAVHTSFRASHTGLSHFEPVSELLTGSVKHFLIRDLDTVCPSGGQVARTPTFVFSIDLGTAVVSEHLPIIDLHDLLPRMYRMHVRTTIQFSLRGTADGVPYIKQRSFTMADLLIRCFICISHAIMKYPGRRWEQCPQIWINSEGYVLRLTWPPSDESHGYTSFEIDQDAHGTISDQQVTALEAQRQGEILARLAGVREHRREATPMLDYETSLFALWLKWNVVELAKW